jgi:nucleotide-binding universal stress UspA family protein
MSTGILVGYDGSDCAKRALEVGIDVAKVYGDKLLIAFGYELNPVAGEMADYAAALRELAESRLSEGKQLAAGSGLEVEAVIVEAAPARALVQLAQERDVRVIVVGTRGERPIRGALIGSTAHKLLHLSERPVLVVPLTDE